MSGLYTAIGAAALSAAGTGVNAYNQNQQMRKQDNDAATSIVNQGRINSQAEGAVKNLNDNIAKSTPTKNTQDQTAAYLQAINSQPAAANTTPKVAGGSKRYTEAQGAAAQDVANYGRSTAENAAAVAAPSLQRIGEGNQIANVASELGRYNDQSANEQGLLRTKLAGDTANPWLGAFSQLLQGAGSGLSTYGGYRSGSKGMGGSVQTG